MSQSELREIVSEETVEASFDAMVMVTPLYELMARLQPEVVITQLCLYATFL